MSFASDFSGETYRQYTELSRPSSRSRPRRNRSFKIAVKLESVLPLPVGAQTSAFSPSSTSGIALWRREEAAVLVDVPAELLDPPLPNGRFEAIEHALVGDIDGVGVEIERGGFGDVTLVRRFSLVALDSDGGTAVGSHVGGVGPVVVGRGGDPSKQFAPGGRHRVEVGADG